MLLRSHLFFALLRIRIRNRIRSICKQTTAVVALERQNAKEERKEMFVSNNFTIILNLQLIILLVLILLVQYKAQRVNEFIQELL